MRTRIKVLLGSALGVTVLASSAGASGTPYVVQERNLSQDGDWHGGEPQVVQAGRTVVVDWPEVQASGVYRNPVTGTFDTAVGTVVGYANDPAFSRCGLAVSHDGGRTFRRTTLPAVTGQSTLCSDATTAVGPDGTLYAATITFNQPTSPLPLVAPGTLPQVSSYQPGQGSADVVIRSEDGGETWSHPPVDAIANRGEAAKRYAPGSNPSKGGEGTCDRPYVTVDQSDGTVYVVGTADVIQFNGSPDFRSWVTASTDKARTFGTVYPVDSADWKQTAGAATIAAVGGRLVVAYLGNDPEGASGVVVETSRDHGRTFSRHFLSATAPSSGPSVLGVNVAADPSHPGTLAVMVPTTAERGVTVWRTRDYGRVWSKGTVVQVGTSRPWLAYSPHGTLGVLGRDVHSDGSQDVYAAFSLAGKGFGAPLRLNRTTAPATPPGTLTLYDDTSDLFLTDTRAWAAWGDWRRSAKNPNGEVQAWLAEVRLR